MRPVLRPFVLLAFSFLLAAPISTGWAALPAGRSPGLELVAPAGDQVVAERALRFAWKAPAAGRHLLLVSRQSFDTRGWTKLPDDPAFQVREVASPVASLEDAHVRIDGEAPLYWAAASVDRSNGRVTFSEVRTVHVIPRFTNRVEPSPYLRTSPVHETQPIARTAPDRIRLRAGYAIDPAQGEPALAANMRVAGDLAPGTRTYLVYYGDADPEVTRKSILASGGLIVSYVPDRAFLVRMKSTGRFSLDSEGAWVGTFQPAYKLSPRLELDTALERTVNMLVFPDGDLAAVQQSIVAAGGRVVLTSNNGINKIVRAALPGARVPELSRHPDVAWIEPYVQPMLDNINMNWVVQTGGPINNRRIWAMGLQGEGQVVNTTDSGINMSHNMFRDPAFPVSDYGDYVSPTPHRKVIAYKPGSSNPNVQWGDHAGASFHGTHTGGTITGNDTTLGTSNLDGIARNAKIYFMDISGPALANGVDPFPDLNDLYLPPYLGNVAGAARVSSNSWGAPVNGDYDLNSLNVDQFTWNHPDFLICFSNGNSTAPGTVGSPATAKNCVGVGGTGNGSSAGLLYNGTSRGPCTDGRRKPMICTPGASVSSSTSGTATYGPLTGTSMASPSAAGAAALMRQYLTEGWYPTGTKTPANGFAPSASLLKAMLVNAGTNMVSAFQAPDNNVGFGRVNIDSVLFFAGDTRRLLLVDQTDGLGFLQAIEYQIQVTDGTIPLEVSLCWMDYPGNPIIANQIVNDLNLTVTNGVSTYLGNWIINGASATGGFYDSFNVEENVRIASPPPGLWTVRVEGANVPFGPQPYGLCITGGVGNDAGAIALDRASYGSSSTVDIQVTDVNAVGPLNVTLTSTTEPAGEIVTLTGGSGRFTGSLPLSPFSGSSGNGALQVSHGDQIVATYADAAPVATLAARATVSIQTPTITAVSATAQGTGTVRVDWSTDVNASSRVYYGTTSTLGSSSPLDPTAVFDHEVSIDGLVPGQTYFYDVESTDLSANVTRDANGGAHYKFTVGIAADLLLAYGGGGFERADRYAAALNALGWSYDIWQANASDAPVLGDQTFGLRSYKAVWWQPGLDYYPPVSDSARTALTEYVNGGGRLAITGHDIAWALAEPTSPYYSADRQTWVLGTLHTVFNADPPGWGPISGVLGDPISDTWSGGVSYGEHRAGASGDEIDGSAGAGTFNYDWISGDSTPDQCGLRWESSGPLGVPGSGVWAGTPSRLAAMYFEWSGIEPLTEPGSLVRNAVMEKTLSWLIGRDRPTVNVTAPLPGTVVTGDNLSITWTETTSSGTNVASRKIESSLDGGQSWTTLSPSAGPSPYVWNLAGVANSARVLVRVRITDDGSPAFSGVDPMNGVFAIDRVGGDVTGPAVVAGSIHANPNPIDNRTTTVLTGSLTEASSGGAGIAAAEWSSGTTPLPAGNGVPMTGSFGGVTASVSAVIAAGVMPLGSQSLWVRGQDDLGNWGTASKLSVVVNGTPPLAVNGTPYRLELAQNAPNPVVRNTVISLSLPEATTVRLAIFDLQGRHVRQLVQGPMNAGIHRFEWDRRDDAGHAVHPGVYYYRLITSDRSLERKLVTLR